MSDDEALGHEGGPIRPDPLQYSLVGPEIGVYEVGPGLTGLGITIIYELKGFTEFV